MKKDNHVASWKKKLAKQWVLTVIIFIRAQTSCSRSRIVCEHMWFWKKNNIWNDWTDTRTNNFRAISRSWIHERNPSQPDQASALPGSPVLTKTVEHILGEANWFFDQSWLGTIVQTWPITPLGLSIPSFRSTRFRQHDVPGWNLDLAQPDPVDSGLLDFTFYLNLHNLFFTDGPLLWEKKRIGMLIILTECRMKNNLYQPSPGMSNFRAIELTHFLSHRVRTAKFAIRGPPLTLF